MLVGLVLAMGLAAMDTTIVATAVPAIVRDLGGFSLFTWVFSMYLLVQSAMVPIFGKLADLYGRKPVLVAGVLIFLVGSILCGFAWNMTALIVFRGVQGIGAGAIQPIVTTVAGDMYSVEERARVQGWLSSAWGVSAILGPLVGGVFADYASWRWIFYINIPIGAMALFIVGVYLHENVAPRQHRIDYAGAALLFFGMGMLILGFVEGNVRWLWVSAPGIGVFTAAVIALAAFVWQEQRAPEPIVPLWVFRHRLLAGANLATMVLGTLIMGVTTFLPIYAQGVLGAGSIVAGFSLGVMSITWAVASALSGRLYLRIGFRDTALVGATICLIAGIIFSLLSKSAPVLVAALGSCVMGVGLGLFFTAIIVGLQYVIGWDHRGVVTGMNMFARQLGQAIGAAMFGGVANSVLVGWFSRPPEGISQQLPSTVDESSGLLAGGRYPSDAVEEFVRQGLYLATHRVFLGLVVVTVICIFAILLTPRRFDWLRFDSKDTF